jgi:hypothetical protein
MYISSKSKTFFLNLNVFLLCTLRVGLIFNLQSLTRIYVLKHALNIPYKVQFVRSKNNDIIFLCFECGDLTVDVRVNRTKKEI